MTTKARTLALLQDVLRTANIAPMVFFRVSDWKLDRTACLGRIQNSLGSGPWIVRSSSFGEDQDSGSNAGAFLSLPNIQPDGVESAINDVIASYDKARDDDEVLIQPMLRNVVRAGVAFSHDPSSRAPYRTINWSEGANTAAVTGGAGGRIWQQAALSPHPPPSAMRPVIDLLNELLALFGNTPIDCEFAFTQDPAGERLWLLQVRPLVIDGALFSPESQACRLSLIEQKIRRGSGPHPFLMGRRTVYGVMPDWNPAEIIGVRPKPLSLSLYRELVTDAIWAYQRHNYGYRNLRSFPLMPHFFGLPYIDVRLSFNSFIPADLPDNLAGRLVDYYLDRLLAEPTLHDKIEFEIVLSCYSLDLPDRMNRLAEVGITSKERGELADSLRRLTNRIIHPKDGYWYADAAKLDKLVSRREQLMASNADPLERIYWLLEDGKRYGTLPFAGLARAGFIAIQMLRSLVTVGVLSEADVDGFMASLSTVGKQLARDRVLLDKATFLSRYGHLRPGTYDILSPRYDEAPDLYFDWTKRGDVPDTAPPFSLTLPQMREVVGLLATHGLHADAVGLFDFLQAGIELREQAKFQFTRNLSDALSLTAAYGELHGFSRADMAYCDISALRELHVAAADPKEAIGRSIEQGKARHTESLSLVLPPVIASPEDVWGFQWPESAPNFITQKEIIATVTSSDADRSRLAGAIICIPNADPGFDWLFAHRIGGLITAWGGANSHMAIRAGELGLPAVIGAGEDLFRRWSQAGRLHIDCAGKRVTVLA